MLVAVPHRVRAQMCPVCGFTSRIPTGRVAHIRSEVLANSDRRLGSHDLCFRASRSPYGIRGLRCASLLDSRNSVVKLDVSTPFPAEMSTLFVRHLHLYCLIFAQLSVERACLSFLFTWGRCVEAQLSSSCPCWAKAREDLVAGR